MGDIYNDVDETRNKKPDSVSCSITFLCYKLHVFCIKCDYNVFLRLADQ